MNDAGDLAHSALPRRTDDWKPVRIALGSASNHNPAYRRSQEDATFLASAEHRNPTTDEATSYAIAVVGDGMGGHERGDEASREATWLVGSYLFQELRYMTDADQMDDIVRGAVWPTNRRIVASQGARGLSGTTIVTAVAASSRWLGSHLAVANVGDARAYSMTAEGSLQMLSEDHTLVADLVRAGQLTPEAAASHPDSHVVTAAIGVASEPALFSMTRIRIEAPIALILATDGAWGPLERASWKKGGASLLEQYGYLLWNLGPEPAAERIVADALVLGSDDNCTVAVMRCDPTAYNQPNQGEDQ